MDDQKEGSVPDAVVDDRRDLWRPWVRSGVVYCSVEELPVLMSADERDVLETDDVSAMMDGSVSGDVVSRLCRGENYRY